MDYDQLELKTDTLRVNLKELYNLDIISTKQYNDITKKIKGWAYDMGKTIKQ